MRKCKNNLVGDRKSIFKCVGKGFGNLTDRPQVGRCCVKRLDVDSKAQKQK